MFSKIIKTECKEAETCKKCKTYYIIKLFITPKKWYELMAVYDKNHIYQYTELILNELLPSDFDGGYASWHINSGWNNKVNLTDLNDEEDYEDDEEILRWSVMYNSSFKKKSLK
jgi:hypothetical protein